MKKFRPNILCIIILFGFVGFSRAQDYKILREYETEKGLKGVITNSHSLTLEPKLYIFQNKIQNSDAKDKKHILISPNQKITISPQNHYFGITTPDISNRGYKTNTDYLFQLFNSDLTKIFSYRRAFSGTEFPKLNISEASQSVTITHADGKYVYSINNKGEAKWGKQLFKGLKTQQYKSMGIISKNGNCFLFFTWTSGKDSQKMKPMLYSFSMNGNLLWKFEVPLLSCHNIGVSESGKYCLISGEKDSDDINVIKTQTLLIDKNGSLLEVFPFGFLQYDFDESREILVLSEYKKINLISTSDRSVHYSLQTGGNGRKNLAVKIIGNKFITLTGQEFLNIDQIIYNHPQVTVWSENGRISYSKMFNLNYTIEGKIHTSPNFKEFGIALHNKFVIFGSSIE